MEKKYLCVWLLIVGVAFAAVTDAADKMPVAQTMSDQPSSGKDSDNSPIVKSPAAGESAKSQGWDWYSKDKEIKLGQDWATEVNAKAVFIDDPAAADYVSRIGQNLVRTSEPKFSFTIRLIDSPEARAFALPGGILYVTSGLLLAADNEAELAAVMSHAIAHVNARHVTRLMSRGAFVGIQRNGFPGYCSIYAMCEKDELSSGPPDVLLKFSRNFETEADWLGIQYAYKAGYDPKSFVTFLKKQAPAESKTPRAVGLSMHPTSAERIAVLEKEIATILPARERNTVDTEEFQTIKARLSNLKMQGSHAAAKR